MGLAAWIGHSIYQPLWKVDRYHASCRKCGTRLERTGREKIASFVFMGAGVSIAVGARALLPGPKLPVMLLAVFGCLIGVLVNYPFARYKAVDPAVVSDLPTVRKVAKGG